MIKQTYEVEIETETELIDISDRIEQAIDKELKNIHERVTITANLLARQKMKKENTILQQARKELKKYKFFLQGKRTEYTRVLFLPLSFYDNPFHKSILKHFKIQNDRIKAR